MTRSCCDIFVVVCRSHGLCRESYDRPCLDNHNADNSIISCPSANLFYSHSKFLAQTAKANVSNAVCRLALVQEKASSRTKRECAQSITNIESQIDKYAGLVLQAARNRFQYEVGNSVALALCNKAISGDCSDGCSSGVLQMAAAVSKLKAAVSKF